MSCGVDHVCRSSCLVAWSQYVRGNEEETQPRTRHSLDSTLVHTPPARSPIHSCTHLQQVAGALGWWTSQALSVYLPSGLRKTQTHPVASACKRLPPSAGKGRALLVNRSSRPRRVAHVFLHPLCCDAPYAVMRGYHMQLQRESHVRVAAWCVVEWLMPKSAPGNLPSRAGEKPPALKTPLELAFGEPLHNTPNCKLPTATLPLLPTAHTHSTQPNTHLASHSPVPAVSAQNWLWPLTIDPSKTHPARRKNT